VHRVVTLKQAENVREVVYLGVLCWWSAIVARCYGGILSYLLTCVWIGLEGSSVVSNGP